MVGGWEVTCSLQELLLHTMHSRLHMVHTAQNNTDLETRGLGLAASEVTWAAGLLEIDSMGRLVKGVNPFSPDHGGCCQRL